MSENSETKSPASNDLLGGPDKFYVYIHRRKDTGEIFYVGKGCGERAWSFDGRNREWVKVACENGRSVEIIAEGMLEPTALLLEGMLMALHKDTIVNIKNGVAFNPFKKKKVRQPPPPIRRHPHYVIRGVEYWWWQKKHFGQKLKSIAQMQSDYGCGIEELRQVIEGTLEFCDGWYIYVRKRNYRRKK